MKPLERQPKENFTGLHFLGKHLNDEIAPDRLILFGF
jgi:hypothetical protein